MGAECPLESTNLSFKKWDVLSAWNLRPYSWKNNTENTSAIDEQEEGWPLLVTLTERMESILSQWAISCQRL